MPGRYWNYDGASGALVRWGRVAVLATLLCRLVGHVQTAAMVCGPSGSTTILLRHPEILETEVC